MIEYQGLEERQQKWKEAQTNVIRTLVGESSPPYELSNIRCPNESGWGNVIYYLCHELSAKSLAVYTMNLAAQHIAKHFLESTEGRSDEKTVEAAGHIIAKVGLLGFNATDKTSLGDEFKDGSVLPLTKGLFALYMKYIEIMEPAQSLERLHRMMGNNNLAQLEAERTEGSTRKDRIHKYMGIDDEQILRFYENAGREVLPLLTSFRREYSSQIITPEHLKQEVLGLVLSVERLWFPRGS